eukprot:8671330-Pyramimonas_sp.AAC.1
MHVPVQRMYTYLRCASQAGLLLRPDRCLPLRVRWWASFRYRLLWSAVLRSVVQDTGLTEGLSS